MANDNFDGDVAITLQPNDSGVPFQFEFKACSSPTANDGSIPFGTTISGVSVTGHTGAGTDVTSQLIANYTLDANLVTVFLNYPSGRGVGTYHLTFVLTLDSGTVMEFDFNEITATNL